HRAAALPARTGSPRRAPAARRRPAPRAAPGGRTGGGGARAGPGRRGGPARTHSRTPGRARAGAPRAGAGRAVPQRRDRTGGGLMDIDMTALRLIERERDISLDVLVAAIEQALLSAYHRTPGAYPDARAELDRRTGHVTIWARERLDGAAGGAEDAEEGPGEHATAPQLGPEFDHTPDGFGRIA